MKTISYLIFALLSTISASAQATNSPTVDHDGITETQIAPGISPEDAGIIAAKQSELSRAAELHGVDLDQHAWNRQGLGICPAFSDHLFVRYQRSDDPNLALIAVYSRKRTGVRIILLGAGFAQRREPASIQNSTISTFNNIWSEERHSSSVNGKFPNLSWSSLAACYAEMAGEKLSLPPGISRTEVVAPISVLDIQHDPIVKEVFLVESDPLTPTSLSIDFGRSGFVQRAFRTESAKPVAIP
jgi:hypothetical protein